MTKYQELNERFKEPDFLDEELDFVFYECKACLEQSDGRPIDHDVWPMYCMTREHFLSCWQISRRGDTPPTTAFHVGNGLPGTSRLFRSVIYLDIETLRNNNPSFVADLVMAVMEELVHATGEHSEEKAVRKAYSLTESYLEYQIPEDWKNKSYERAKARDQAADAPLI